MMSLMDLLKYSPLTTDLQSGTLVITDTSSLARGLDLVRKMDCGLGSPLHVKVHKQAK